jgi:hypothetical protein
MRAFPVWVQRVDAERARRFRAEKVNDPEAFRANHDGGL